MGFHDCKTAEEEHSYLRSERIRHAAVDILDEFTKSWCVDKEETLAKK